MHGPGLQSSGGDTSQSSLVPISVQPTVPMTVNDNTSTASSCVTESEPAPVSEAPPQISSDGASETSAEHSDPLLANIKEKTPMCLINELARFNKVSLFVYLHACHTQGVERWLKCLELVV